MQQMRKSFSLYTITLVAILLVFNSCKKEYESIESIDEAKIQAYITKNNLSVTKDESGFYYQITKEGTGDLFKNSDSVLYNINIKGINETQYLKSPDNGNLGTYVGYSSDLLLKDVPAVRAAILKLRPGGSARIILPSYLAFGKNGTGDIPSNEIIILDIFTYVQKVQWRLDEDRIEEFLEAKGMTATTTRDPSRIWYQVITPGTGTDVIDINSTVTTSYTGRTLDGDVFDSSASYAVPLTQTIVGWGKILPLFTSGAKIRVFIPSDLAYSTLGSGPVPPNAVLDFDIEIISVTNPQ